MGIRDLEIERIKNYAKGLGVEIVFKPPQGAGHQAEWANDGSQITIYTHKKKSKMDLILDLIHELAHHISWVHEGRTIPLKTDRALDSEDSRRRNDPPIAKSQRKLIYESEKFDAQYQEIIFNELGITIPKYKFLAARDLDIWVYFRYYQSGDFPSREENRIKYKELLEKYKNV